MTTKERIRGLLEGCGGEYISGNDIGRRLGISRNAVWKTIRLLTKEGYRIDSLGNKGYRLSFDNDVLSGEGILKLLDKPEQITVNIYESIDSTNKALKVKAEEGASEGLLIASSKQTCGRGRLGRSFFSPAGSGVYFSLLLRPEMETEKAVFITTAAAVALCKTIEGFGTAAGAPGIKWVNDIYINERKTCGILTEAAVNFETKALDYAVLGIGVNLYMPEHGFPDDIADIAGSVFKERVGNAKNRVIAGFVNNFMPLYKNYNGGYTADSYRFYDITAGRQITVYNKSEVRQAIALGIDEQCRLVVQYADKSTETLSSGEVKIKL